ncbi:hypothetical protein Hamer_G025137 [Homarus americanus]|uniref:Uncharacterized protein n=1 Tax=Homarus americanus TaxID=6706 RepID=A0A8J5JKP5_HOMAM|nr:hypothetical protein Hamer_G025137 [Homarus americanus]
MNTNETTVIVKSSDSDVISLLAHRYAANNLKTQVMMDSRAGDKRYLVKHPNFMERFQKMGERTDLAYKEFNELENFTCEFSGYQNDHLVNKILMLRFYTRALSLRRGPIVESYTKFLWLGEKEEVEEGDMKTRRRKRRKRKKNKKTNNNDDEGKHDEEEDKEKDEDEIEERNSKMAQKYLVTLMLVTLLAFPCCVADDDHNPNLDDNTELCEPLSDDDEDPCTRLQEVLKNIQQVTEEVNEGKTTKEQLDNLKEYSKELQEIVEIAKENLTFNVKKAEEAVQKKIDDQGSGSDNTLAIVFGVIGGLLGLAIISYGCYLLYKEKKTKKARGGGDNSQENGEVNDAFNEE